MSLPYPTDPSLPSNPSPLFADTAAARGDHLRAFSSEIWSNLSFLDLKALLNPIQLSGTSGSPIVIGNTLKSIVGFAVVIGNYWSDGPFGSTSTMLIGIHMGDGTNGQEFCFVDGTDLRSWRRTLTARVYSSGTQITDTNGNPVQNAIAVSSASLKTTIIANPFSPLFLITNTSTDIPPGVYVGVANVEWTSASTFKVIVYATKKNLSTVSRAVWSISCYQGTWDSAWQPIADDNGGVATTLTNQTICTGAGIALFNLYNQLIGKYGTAAWDHGAFGALAESGTSRNWVISRAECDGAGNITLHGCFISYSTYGSFAVGSTSVSASSSITGSWYIMS